MRARDAGGGWARTSKTLPVSAAPGGKRPREDVQVVGEIKSLHSAQYFKKSGATRQRLGFFNSRIDQLDWIHGISPH